jgi:hypothetical protein
MKSTLKNITALLVAAGLSISIYSCKKDNSSVDTAVTEADAAELATNAVVTSTGGLALQINSSVAVYKTVTFTCGAQKDSSISKSSVSGAVPAYNYSLKWSYLLNCSSNQLTANFSGSSSYDGLRMSSTDNSTGSFILGGILPATAPYTLNTTYTRNGSQTSKIGRNNTFTSNLSITSTNVTVDKTTLQILSGTAAVSISGSSTSGKTFNFNGTLTYLGGNKATLVLNSGAAYAIQW